MRLLLVQRLDPDLEPVFIGRTPDGSFHVIWRQELLGSAPHLMGAIRLACKGRLQHPQYGPVPRFSPRLEDWTLCTGQHRTEALQATRHAGGLDAAPARRARIRRAVSAVERLARLEAAARKERDRH